MFINNQKFYSSTVSSMYQLNSDWEKSVGVAVSYYLITT